MKLFTFLLWITRINVDNIVQKYQFSFFFYWLLPIFYFFTSCHTETVNRKQLATPTVPAPTEQQLLKRKWRSSPLIYLVYSADEPYLDFFQKYQEITVQYWGNKKQIITISSTDWQQKELYDYPMIFAGRSTILSLPDSLRRQLPVQFSEKGFAFGDRHFSNHNDIFQIKNYPNPLNTEQPITLLGGNSDTAILTRLIQLADSGWRQLLWNDWDYQVLQDGQRLWMGHFANDWSLEASSQFDFRQSPDTILSSDHFKMTIHQNSFPVDSFLPILEYCEKNYHQTKAFLGDFLEDDFPHKTFHYQVFPSVEQKGLQTGSMDIATVDFEKQEVRVVVNDFFRGDRHQAENRIFIRAALGIPEIPALEIGLTNYFAPQWQKKGADYWTGRLFTSNNLPLLEVLANTRSFQQESPLVAGAMSAVLVEFLLKKWGKTAFLKKYANLQSQDLLDLRAEWEAFLQKKYQNSSVAITNTSPTDFYWQGFNFAHEGYQVYNGYGSALAQKSLMELASVGSNATAIVPYSYMRHPNQPSPIPIIRQAGTENDEAVLFAHYTAKKLGMSTLLKPQLWLGSNWPGALKMENEADWQAFFEHYYRWIRHYALLAEMHDFDALCIGVEFAQATLSREADWRWLIQKVRGIYSGSITYAANWGEEFEQVSFWDELDFIGLNCYYPLSDAENPSERELSDTFKKTMDKVERVVSRFNKPLVFTEIGFRSTTTPWKNPHADAEGHVVDEQAQALCYKVVLKEIAQRDWVQGVLWWKWPSFLDYRGTPNIGFSPNRKVAEGIVRKYFQTKG